MFENLRVQEKVVFIGWFCLLVLVAGTSCTQDPVSDTDPVEVASSAEQFLQSRPEIAKMFRKSEAVVASHFRVEVLVDMTASMEGYVNSTAIAAHNSTAAHGKKVASPLGVGLPESDFFHLLHQLANENELTEFVGFGSDRNGGATTFSSYGKAPPMNASDYRRNDNDYADLLNELEKRSQENDHEPIERVIITDGVQSHQDKGQGSALAKTVEKLRAWVVKGGAVEMRLFRAPYSGKYYSEELRARNLPYSFVGHSESRPFLVITLLSRRDDLAAWKRFWERSAFSELKQVAYLCYPSPQAAVSGLGISPEERIPKEIAVPVLFHNVWDLAKILTLDTYHDLWRANVRRIQTQDVPRPPSYPACLVLSGMSPSADLEADLREMNPELEVWRSTPPRADAKSDATPAKITAPPNTDSLTFAWEKTNAIDLRDPKNGKVRIDRLEAPACGFRFTATLPTPSKNKMQVVIFSAKPKGKKTLVPNWNEFSTVDDSSALKLDRIYNLQPFVEQLTSDEVSDPTPLATAIFTYH